MLIYEIPTDPYSNPMAIPEFTQIFLDALLVDSCFFDIVTENDPRDHLHNLKYSYLIIPDIYETYFQSLLSKYGARKLKSLPSFTRFAKLAGDERAITKIAQ